MSPESTENQNSDVVSQPSAPQEPIPETPIPPSTSEHAPMSPETLEFPREAEGAVPVNNPSDAEAMAGKNNPEIEPVEATPEQTAPSTAEGSGRAQQTDNSSVNEPLPEISQPETAQVPGNEPLAPAPDRLSLLAKAREMIQFRKRKKLDKIMSMFLKKAEITNDEVEKLLHVSDATATRYLEQLEKEEKIKQEGRTGKSVSYSRM